MKSKKARNPGGGNAMSAASGSRDRSGGMAGPRVGGSKDSTSMRHSSNRPMSSSPSRMTVDSHYQNRGANYPQHSGNDGNSVGGSSNVAEGVYSNKRLIHACTCLIGTTVQVETIDGNIHEGLFRIFSPELEITLEQAHQIDPKNPTDITAESVKEIMIFEMKEVLHMSAIGVDLDYAAKDGFQTDTQISNKNNGEGGVGTGSGSNFRELKEFEFEDYSMNDDRLDGSFSIEKDRALEDGSNGWSADDMFLLNEKKYGVQTSYKENMEGYTIQLKHDDKSSDEYRDREAKAAKVAREIEGNTSTHLAAELENGDDDEENAFSAVQRDPSQRGDVRDSDGGGKYIPPARRQPSVSSSSGMPMKQHVNSGSRSCTPVSHVSHNPKRKLSSSFQYHGNNQATAANIPAASIASKQPCDYSSNVRSDTRISQSQTVSEASIRMESPISIPNLEPMISFVSSESDVMPISSSSETMSFREATPQESKMAEKSTLNPSAKEFVVNSPANVLVPAAPLQHVMASTRQIPPGFSPHKMYAQRQINPEQVINSQAHPISIEYSQHSTQFPGHSSVESQLSPYKTYAQRPMNAGQFVSAQSHAMQINYNTQQVAHFQGQSQDDTYAAGAHGTPVTAIQSHPQMHGQLIHYLQSPVTYTGQPGMSNVLPQNMIQVQGTQIPENSSMNLQFQGQPNTEASYSAMNGIPGNAAISAMQSHPQMQGQMIQYVQNPAAYLTQGGMSTLLPQGLIQIQGSQMQESLSVNTSFQSQSRQEGNFSSFNGVQGSPSVATMRPHPQMNGQIIQFVQNPAGYAMHPGLSNISAQTMIQMQGSPMQEVAPMNTSLQGHSQMENNFSALREAQGSPSLSARPQSRLQNHGTNPYASPMPVKYFHRPQ